MKKNGWKKFENKNVTMALNVLYAKNINISCFFKKHNPNCEKQVIPSMIPYGEGQEGCKDKSEGQQWNYLAVKS